MAWDINERGAIDITPLLDWETAIIQDSGCGLRLIFARPEDRPGTGSIVVQTALTIGQAEELIRHLQQMVEQILRPSTAQPH